MKIVESCRVAGVVLLLSGVAAASESVRTNYYAWGGGTKNTFSYNWFSPDNWRVKDDGGNYVQPTCVPQDGDIVIFNKSISYMSAAYGTTKALWKIDFQKGNTIHQGIVNLLAGGEGLTMSESMGWWAGMQFTGTGEVPIHVPAGLTFTDQQGVKGTATLVKTGDGTFRTSGEGASPYEPTVTKLQGGQFWIKASNTLGAGEFIFDSNSADLRLVLENSYTRDGKVNWYNSWIIHNGALRESASVDNTTHGISTSDALGKAYLRLIGTPKEAEQRFTGQLYNTAGISFAPGAKQTGGADYVFTIAKSESSCSGGLAVTNGTLRLAEGATFEALAVLNVGAGGTFEVQTGSGRKFYCQKLDVQTGGKIKVASGVTLTFSNDAQVGGEPVTPGTTYTADGAGSTTAADWIEGEGQVVIKAAPGTEPITLTVAEGQTVDLDTALAAFCAANPGETVSRKSLDGGMDVLRPIYKEGAGTLLLTNAVPGWTGTFVVKAGFVNQRSLHAFGADSSEKRIEVEAGGAIVQEVASGRKTGYNANQTFYIAGTGPDGAGALRTSDVWLDYGADNIFGEKLVLTDDAAVKVGRWYYVSRKVTLNGHALTVSNVVSGEPIFISRFLDSGTLILANTQERNTSAVIDQPLNITMKTNGGWRLWDSYNSGAGLADTQVTVEGAAYFYGDSINGDGILRTSKANGIYFPITFLQGGSITCTSQNNNKFGTIRFHSTLAGPGKVVIQNQGSPTFVHLFNPANAFTGGATVYSGVLNVYEPGTLPAACPVNLNGAAGIVKTSASPLPLPAYYGVAFLTPDVQTLASLTAEGTFSRRVQGGCGRWTGAVTKKSVSTLEYYTELGGPLLDVRQGTVKLPRGAAPGLWEGTNLCADATAVAAAFAGAATPTNLVMRGPHSANAHANVNYTGASANQLITYSGYVWNRGASNATWTLASSVNGPVRIEIDGETVLSTSAAALQKAQVTLTPGAHTFVYRSYNGSPRETGWAAKCGFMYDVQGRDGDTTNTYAYCVDPGDGSLFTRTTDAAALPAFDEMTFAPGTCLDVNGNAYTAATVSGWPVVTNSATDASAAASFVITNAFVVNAADLPAGRKMVVRMPLSFGDTGGVSVTNLAGLARGTYTLAETTAADPIAFTGARSIYNRMKTDADNWFVRPAPDGRSLQLVHSAGTMLLVR